MPPLTNAKTSMVVTAAYPGSVAGFRGDLIRACVAAGCTVTVMSAPATPETEAEIRALGANFQGYAIERNAISITADRQTLSDLKMAFVELDPDLILAYTIKPIIWGGIAARRRCKKNRTKFFALVTGLGYAFQGTSLKRRLLNFTVTRLYRFALKYAQAVIFQNQDNRDLFVERGIVAASKCYVVNGSGVNVASFPQTKLQDGPPHFLLIARLLGEKGIREYCYAAEQVKQKYPDAIFSLVGPVDPSPDGIPIDEIQKWHASGTIEYHGATNRVQPFISNCHIYTLPSYHEGMPRTVLESMAMGRPILTTDVPGCRDTVTAGVNGFLVPKGDAVALTRRMTWFIENRDKWQTMGDASRELVLQKFDVCKVNEAMLTIMGLPTVKHSNPASNV